MARKAIHTATETAKLLGVHRQTFYYWLKRGWIKPRRDFKGWPVFTDADIKKLKKWYRTLR